MRRLEEDNGSIARRNMLKEISHRTWKLYKAGLITKGQYFEKMCRLKELKGI